MKFTSEYIAECRKARGGPWVFSEPREALAEIERLNSQLSARDALIERLIEAGKNPVYVARTWEWLIGAVDKWDSAIAEWKAMKGAQ